MPSAVRPSVWMPMWLLLVGLSVLGLLFLMVRPAAQISSEIPLALSADQELSVLLAGDTVALPAGDYVDTARIRAFYAARGYRPAWNDPEAAALAFDALNRASEEGLDPADYHVEALSRSRLANSPAAKAQFELLLTDGVLRYAQHLHSGRILPSVVDADIAFRPAPFDSAAALQRALADGAVSDFLHQLAPLHPEYAHLREALGAYRAVAARGGWDSLPAAVEVKRLGEDSRQALIARRLAMEDLDFAGLKYPTVEQTAATLERYQRSNGLRPDGKLGPRTLAMLNVPVSERIAQIETNMERWRWMPRQFEERYLAVNTADATLRAVRDRKVVLTSRVIVGAPDKRSPMLRAVAKEITVNPPWKVPASIAVKEILPKLRRDRTYLQSQHMVLANGPKDDPHGLAIDWRKVGAKNFPYRFMQLPGPGNALGAVKLEMPNSFDIYLHDTPGKAAFERDPRALSHGCIRVQDILPLASLALNGDVAGALPEIAAAIETGETKHFPLPKPLPVYVLYWTALPNADGTFGFRGDVYGRDKRLLVALESRRRLPLQSFLIRGCTLDAG